MRGLLVRDPYAGAVSPRLAALADRSGAVQIPIGELQALSGMSLRPVLRAVRGLVDAGLVRVEHPYRPGRGRGKGGGRLPNRYVLLRGQ